MKIKNWIKNHWKNFVDYFHINKKIIFRNFIIAFVVSFAFLLLDLLTKQFLFIESNANSGSAIQHANWLFGIRSVKNPGLTFFGSKEINIALISFFNILILLACLISLIFLKNTFLIIAIGLIFSGALGNTIDRLTFNYVRDIIYLPWFDRGTFNFADVEVITGSILFASSMLIIIIRN